MIPSKDKVSADRWEKIRIDGAVCTKYGLPQKAIGNWAIFRNDGWRYWLRKIRLDGLLMSSKGNNHQAISARIFENILAETNERIAKEKSEKEYAEILANLSQRKLKWINMLIAKMKADDELSVIFEKLREVEIRRRIIDDADINREGGKLYSSISSAYAVWRKRGKNMNEAKGVK